MLRFCNAMFALMVAFSLVNVSLGADEVALPNLPAGAGQMDRDAPTTFIKSPTGLKYRVLRKGTGAGPRAASTVTCHYHGWLDNGKVFDSSYARREPASFRLGGVIAGWTEGLQMVGNGGMIELEVPYDMAYGAQGNPPAIPPKATLHFVVELLEVK